MILTHEICKFVGKKVPHCVAAVFTRKNVQLKILNVWTLLTLGSGLVWFGLVTFDHCKSINWASLMMNKDFRGQTRKYLHTLHYHYVSHFKTSYSWPRLKLSLFLRYVLIFLIQKPLSLSEDFPAEQVEFPDWKLMVLSKC